MLVTAFLKNASKAKLISKILKSTIAYIFYFLFLFFDVVRIRDRDNTTASRITVRAKRAAIDFSGGRGSEDDLV